MTTSRSQPDSGGSQFFIVYDDSSSLPPDYTVFGDLDAESLETVRAVAEQGTETGHGCGRAEVHGSIVT